MGFGNRSANTKWFAASGGRFTSGSKKNNNQQEFDYIEGMLAGIEFKDDVYEGKQFRKVEFTLLDGDLLMKFGTNATNGYARQIMMKLPNCDLAKPVRFQLSYEATPKKKAGAFVNQGTVSIKQKWTQENPGSLPQLKKVMFKGEEQWDGSEQSAWLEEYIMTHVVPKIVSQSASNDESESANGGDASPADGEFPF